MNAAGDGARRSSTRLADDGPELEDRQVHGDDETADQHAEDRHDQRLEQAGHAVDRGIDVFFIERGDFAGHGIERAGFLANRDHLHHHVGEQAGVFHRTLQALPGGYLIAHFHNAVLQHDVTGGAGHRFQRLDQRYAGGKHGRQRARVASDRRLVENRSDDGHLERSAVEELTQLARTFVKIEKRPDCGPDHHGDIDAVVLYELGDVDDHLRKGRQIGAEALEQFFELRDHKNQQDYGHHQGYREHRGRIEQRLLDLLLDRLALFLIGRDLVEQAFERSGLLTRLHQIDEQIVEIQRMLGERLVQRGATLDLGLDLEHQLLHRRLVVAGADDFEGLYQRNAGAEHRGQLAAEDRDVFGPDLAAAFESLRLLPDPSGHHPLSTQVRFERLLILRDRAALDPLALAVHALPIEGGILSDRANCGG